MAKRNWQEILAHAKIIVNSYDTLVTLRQLFYRLVADKTLANTRSEYNSLSSQTARARRDGYFPDLMDRTRGIERFYPLFQSTDEANEWLKNRYRRDRTEGQEWSIYLSVEKAGIVNQLNQWFGRPLGIPILPLQGYTSQTFVDDVVKDTWSHYANIVHNDPRPTVLIYAGDFDPSGEDIDRDFTERTSCWDKVHRVALVRDPDRGIDQIAEYNLPPAMGKVSDTRAAQFMARHGELIQVELDALPVDALRALYQEQIDEYWDEDAHARVMQREKKERDSL
jgi:hypothetical protein